MPQRSHDQHAATQPQQQHATTAPREQASVQLQSVVEGATAPTPASILQLQQNAGNQAAARLIQKKPQEIARQAQPTFGDSDPRGVISGLHPTLQSKVRALVENAHKRGLNIQVFEGLRTIERQNSLYAQGRDAQGNVVDASKVVTKVKGGDSHHNYGVAVDVVFHGAQPWGEQHDWAGLGKSGEEAGLEWGGSWKSFVDRPHFQLPGLTITQLKTWHATGGMENVWKQVSGNSGGAEKSNGQDTPAAQPAPTAPAPVSGNPIGIASVTASGLNVRQGPGTAHAILGVLQKGAQASVIKREGAWLVVDYSGKSGYIHGDYATFTPLPPAAQQPAAGQSKSVWSQLGSFLSGVGQAVGGIAKGIGSWLGSLFTGQQQQPAPGTTAQQPASTTAPTTTPATTPPTQAPAAPRELSYAANGTQYFDVANQITSIMEGGATAGKYDALTTVADGGIISYGKHQATLASGSLTSILTAYVAASQSNNAKTISSYMERVRAKDASLKNDTTFLNALRSAAAEKEMQTAQDMVFRQGYWNPAVTAAQNQGIRTPLGYAMLYDTKIQGGMESCLEAARAKCGGAIGQRVGDKTISEVDFLKAFNDVREARLERLAQEAEAKNELTRARALRGSKYRCTAFRRLLDAGNLNIAGPEGKVEITGPGSGKYTITGFDSGQAAAPVTGGATTGQQPAAPETVIARGVVTASTLNVRRGPEATGTALGQLKEGAAVEITGQSGSWLRINYNGQPAYVHSNYVRVQQQGGQTTQPTPPTGAAANVQITFGSNANSSVISKYTLDVLKGILSNAGETSAIITSTVRTPADQARIMYNNIVTYGVTHQKNLYGAGGDAVIDVYAAQKNAGATEAAIRKAMENKINEVGPGNVSRHCSDPTILQVVDIAPSSIKNGTKFIDALKAAVAAGQISKYIPPPGDPAYHIEIPQ